MYRNLSEIQRKTLAKILSDFFLIVWSSLKTRYLTDRNYFACFTRLLKLELQ